MSGRPNYDPGRGLTTLYQYRYKAKSMKPVVFLGDSVARLRAFPDGPRRDAGFQLDRVQRGMDPDDWKPMKSIGPGVREIRVRDAAGAFRVIYVATFAEAVYVFHAFQKRRRGRPRATSLLQKRDTAN
jgi:phage-related protein